MINKLFDKAWPYIFSQRIGFLIGIVVSAIFVFGFWGSAIKNYENFGSYLGEYRITKGRSKTIAPNELAIYFENHIFRTDSLLMYPFIKINNRNITQMPYDEQFFYQSSTYHYMVRLTDLDEGKDTTATFEVFRKEYPETRLKP